MTEDTKLIIEMLNDLRSDMDNKFEEVKTDVQEIKMTLENETNKRIKLIAEGHFDLERKLNEAIQLDRERDLYNIRLSILEEKVENLRKVE